MARQKPLSMAVEGHAAWARGLHHARKAALAPDANWSRRAWCIGVRL